MAKRDMLLYMLKVNQQALKQLIDHITEAESLTRHNGHGNHIRWHTGHLICYNSNGLTLLGEANENDKSLSKLFGAGSEIADDPAAYPSMAELKQQLYGVYERAIELIEDMTEADLEKQFGEGEKKRPIWQPLAFYCLHDFYHAGQITALRRALGRERPFA